MWQAEADTELTLSALPATAVGQSKLYPGESRLEYGMINVELSEKMSSIQILPEDFTAFFLVALSYVVSG